MAFRLTLWYATIFSAASFLVFVVLYLLLVSGTLKRTDIALVDQAEEFASLLQTQGLDAVKTETTQEAAAAGTETLFFRILSTAGEQLSTSDTSKWTMVEIDVEACAKAALGTPVFQAIEPDNDVPGVRVLYYKLGSGTIIQIGRSLEADEQLFRDYRAIFAVVMLTVMALATVVGWLMARKAMAGVEEVSRTAETISAGLLDSRVPLSGRGDEIDRLGSTFNAMLDRISALMTSMRNMTDDIAHELRSPVTRMRVSAEVTLTAQASQAEFEAALADTIEECDRLLVLINTMLDISETEAGVEKLRLSNVDLNVLVQEAVDFVQLPADDRRVELCFESCEDAVVKGDPEKIKRAVLNVAVNAVKYSPSGGLVALSTENADNEVILSVRDSGPGIAAADLPRVFDRFFRADKSRTEPGSGLGLSMTQAIVRAHGGKVTIESCPGQGTTVRIVLPRRGPLRALEGR